MAKEIGIITIHPIRYKMTKKSPWKNGLAVSGDKGCFLDDKGFPMQDVFDFEDKDCASTTFYLKRKTK